MPNHLIDNFAIYSSGHYIPQQQFFDQQTCKHPHHLYQLQNIGDLHGHPLPKATELKAESSPEINILEDSNESSRSSFKSEEDNKKIEAIGKEIKNDKSIVNLPSLLPIQSNLPQKSLNSPKTNLSPSIKLNSMTCSICNQVFKSAKFLQVHLYLNHSNKKEDECELAKANADKVQSKEELAKQKMNECKICNKVMNNLDQLKEVRTLY